MKFTSWNPSNPLQFARSISNNKLELLEIREQNESRIPFVCDSLSTSAPITAFEWQYSTMNPLLAYGTSIGSIGIVNWQNRKEVKIS
jgi:hypothetical protein